MSLKNNKVPSCEEIEEFIKKSMGQAVLLPTQPKVCALRIRENIQRLMNDEEPPHILVADGLICRGHHRYVAGMILNKLPPMIVWRRPSIVDPREWTDIEVDCSVKWPGF